MQQNLEILVGRKEKVGRKFRRTTLRGGVIEDNLPIFQYLFKSDICLLIRYGGSIIISVWTMIEVDFFVRGILGSQMM
jgi:hypothetical protein